MPEFSSREPVAVHRPWQGLILPQRPSNRQIEERLRRETDGAIDSAVARGIAGVPPLGSDKGLSTMQAFNLLQDTLGQAIFNIRHPQAIQGSHQGNGLIRKADAAVRAYFAARNLTPAHVDLIFKLAHQVPRPIQEGDPAAGPLRTERRVPVICILPQTFGSRERRGAVGIQVEPVQVTLKPFQGSSAEKETQIKRLLQRGPDTSQLQYARDSDVGKWYLELFGDFTGRVPYPAEVPKTVFRPRLGVFGEAVRVGLQAKGLSHFLLPPARRRHAEVEWQKGQHINIEEGRYVWEALALRRTLTFFELVEAKVTLEVNCSFRESSK